MWPRTCWHTRLEWTIQASLALLKLHPPCQLSRQEPRASRKSTAGGYGGGEADYPLYWKNQKKWAVTEKWLILLGILANRLGINLGSNQAINDLFRACSKTSALFRELLRVEPAVRTKNSAKPGCSAARSGPDLRRVQGSGGLQSDLWHGEAQAPTPKRGRAAAAAAAAASAAHRCLHITKPVSSTEREKLGFRVLVFRSFPLTISFFLTSEVPPSSEMSQIPLIHSFFLLHSPLNISELSGFRNIQIPLWCAIFLDAWSNSRSSGLRDPVVFTFLTLFD